MHQHATLWSLKVGFDLQPATQSLKPKNTHNAETDNVQLLLAQIENPELSNVSIVKVHFPFKRTGSLMYCTS